MRQSCTAAAVQSCLIAAALASCADWQPTADGFTERDLALFETMVFAQPASDPGNAWVDDADAIALGQKLFFDQSLAFDTANKPVSCATCHNPQGWFSDTRVANAVSAGVGVTNRNSPSLVNAWAYRWKGWDGRADALWNQSIHAWVSPRTMAGTRDRLLAAVRTRYACEFERAFGHVMPLPSWDAPSDARDAAYVLVLKAWGAYLAQLTSRDAPFDRYATGDRDALTTPQKRGLALFIGKAGCIQCHSGPTFAADEFHNIGVGQSGVTGDPGRANGLKELALLKPVFRPEGAATPELTPADLGKMRVKSLRHVAQTGPYFHGGQAATLKDVVWFYNQGGDRTGAGAVSPFIVPLEMSDEELADLQAFLEALTGQPVDARWTCDPSADATRPLAQHADVTVVDAATVTTTAGVTVRAAPGASLNIYAGPLVDGGVGWHVTEFGTAALPRPFTTCEPASCQ